MTGLTAKLYEQFTMADQPAHLPRIRQRPVDLLQPIGVLEYELSRALPEELKSSLPTIEEIGAELSGEAEDGE